MSDAVRDAIAADDRVALAHALHPDLGELLKGRTPEQTAEGKLADGELDPRGYVVACSRCFRQWWGTPDNLPITAVDCPRLLCPSNPPQPKEKIT